MSEETSMVENQPLNEKSSAVQAHLTLMQGVINRMAENSRSCKVWCVTLVAAVLVLVARTGEPQHALIALAPVLLFLFLDTYYLALEQAFRNSYNEFVGKLHGNGHFEPDLFKVERTGMGFALVWKCLRSTSVWSFYTLVTVTIFLAWWIIIPSDTPLAGG